MTLALNQHRCRPDYTIRLVTGQAIAILSDRCELYEYSTRFIFLSPYLTIIRRETENVRCRIFRKSYNFSRVRRILVEFYLRISQRRSIPTIFICFHLLFIGSCAIMRWSFVWWKKFRLMDWKIGLNCQSYSLYVYNAILMTFEQQTGMFLRPRARRFFVTRAYTFQGKYKRINSKAETLHGPIAII